MYLQIKSTVIYELWPSEKYHRQYTNIWVMEKDKNLIKNWGSDQLFTKLKQWFCSKSHRDKNKEIYMTTVMILLG